MKAMVNEKYGTPDDLQLVDIDKPTPGPDEVLMKVHATSINISDWFILTGTPLLIRPMLGSLTRPGTTILGADIAGTVEAVGKHVTDFKPGDAVFGDSAKRGGLGEWAAIPADVLTKKPENISFESASTIPLAGVTALRAVRKAGIKPGDSVLIYGASGGVGVFLVQIAKAYGAEVTAVVSTNKVEMARSIGADHVIDYRKEDFTKSGKQFDMIIAANGYQHLRTYKKVLAPQGTYLCTGGSMRQMFGVMLLGWVHNRKDGQTFSMVSTEPEAEPLRELAELTEAGKITPIIDKCFPLDQADEAFRYYDTHSIVGKVVVTIA